MRIKPAEEQSTFQFPLPTIEERIAHIPKEQKKLAQVVESERQNLRIALNFFAYSAGYLVEIQDQAIRLLQRIDTIDPIELAEAVQDMHYPRERTHAHTAGFIAIAKTHRALREYKTEKLHSEPTHIGDTCDEFRTALKALTRKGSNGEKARKAWDELHRGMEPFDPLR